MRVAIVSTVVLILATACAGYNATIWKDPPAPVCEIKICRVYGSEKVCGCGKRSDIDRVLRGP